MDRLSKVVSKGTRCAALAVLATLALSLVYLPGLAAQQESAQDTFNKRCAVCHAKDGSGQTIIGKQAKMKTVSDYVKQSSEAAMIEIVTNGKKGTSMAPFKAAFTPAQIKGLVEYFRSLAKK